jgi:hypothetical protein
LSSVKFVFPKPTLGKLLRAPGGLAVADAMDRTQANLEQLRPECLAELRALIARIESCFEGAAANADGAPVRELYALAAQGVGMGAVAGVPGADVALISLCKLVDYLQTQGRWDPAGILVHVRALKFLAVADAASLAQADAMLAGLERVTAHYGKDCPDSDAAEPSA